MDGKYIIPGRFCSYPNCPNKITAVTLRSLSFHRVPSSDKDLLKLWLLALQIEPSTPTETVKRKDHKVCSVHFDPGDFYPRKPEPAPVQKRTSLSKEGIQRTKLKPNAVPRTVSCVSAESKVTLLL